MSNPVRPSVLPAWTQGNNSARTQPTSGEQLTGYVANQRPPAQQHNWLFGIFSDWIQWFDFVSNPSGFVITPTANTTVGAPVSQVLAKASGGAFTITLPAAASNPGYAVAIKNYTFTGSNAVNVAPTGSDTIENVNAPTALTPGQSFIFVSDGVSGYGIVGT